METLTVYAETYRELQAREMEYATELAKLKGNIIALAEIIKRDPVWVEQHLDTMAAQFKGEHA
jgi:hypothetical protein